MRYLIGEVPIVDSNMRMKFVRAMQEKDLANDPAHSEKLAEMRGRFARLKAAAK